MHTRTYLHVLMHTHTNIGKMAQTPSQDTGYSNIVIKNMHTPHICSFTLIHTYIHSYIFIHAHTYSYTLIHAHTCSYMYTQGYIFGAPGVVERYCGEFGDPEFLAYRCSCKYAYTHIHTYTHTHIYIYIYIY